MDSKITDMVPQCSLAEDLEIGHATSPVAGDAPDLQGVDRGVEEHTGESRGQAVEDIRNEIEVVKDIASPRHDPAVIEDRLTPLLPLSASPSEPRRCLGGVAGIARHERGDRALAPGLAVDLEEFNTQRNQHVSE
jgi:hypothetical protein